MTKTLGIDVSFWQDRNDTPQGVDWQKARSAGAVFAFIKASQDTWKDQDFDYNWSHAKAAGILRGAYHFYDYRRSPTTQAHYLANLLKDDPGELPPVLDLELYPAWGEAKRSNLLANVQAFLITMKQEGYDRVIFYSNPSMILYTLNPIPDWLTKYPLWIAHYGVSEPMAKAVAPWGKWTFWQYTDKGDGLAFGMESKGLDMDWFNGSEAELRAFAGLQAAPTPLELTDAEKLDRLWEAHRELH